MLNITIPFSIPSIHDNISLECRLHLPSSPLPSANPTSSTTCTTTLAILAHPYAPLSSSLHDPILAHLTSLLLRRNIIVLTFNFRGAGKSDGRTSWSGEGEKGDYESVVGWGVGFVVERERMRGKAEGMGGGEDGAAAEHGGEDGDRRGGAGAGAGAGEGEGISIQVILGGYSYGSMIASRVRPAEKIYRRFTNHSEPERDGKDRQDIYNEINAHAARMAREYIARGTERESSAQVSAAPPPRIPLRINTFYLLVSPLLPPLTTLFSLAFPFPFSVSCTSSCSFINLLSHSSPQHKQEHQHLVQPECATFAVFGSQDGFMSSAKLEAWCGKMAAVPQSRFRWRIIDGAGHFWREEGALGRLLGSVEEWLDDTVLTST